MIRSKTAVGEPCRLAALSFLFLVWILAMMVVAGRVAAAESADDPLAFISSFADEGLALLSKEEQDSADRQAAFRDLLGRYFDLPRTGRITLGRHWKRATPDERAEYERLFREYVVVSTTRRLQGYADNDLEVRGARVINEREILVDSRFTTAGAEPVRVQWNLFKGEEGLRILDVMIEGVSQVLTQRNEFDSVIRAGGGEIEALLEVLRKQTADLAKPS